MKKIIISLISLLTALSSSYAVNSTITLGGVANYNFVYGGVGIKYSVANSTGNATTIGIQYGITSSYGSSTTNVVFTGPGTGVFTNEITGLALGQVYHYSITATDISGATNSPDSTFTNNAVGVVTYLAMINYVRQVIGTNFNTNTSPYVISNLNGLTMTNIILVNPTLTNGNFVTPAVLNGDSLVGNGLSSVVAAYVNTNYTVTSSALSNSLYNVPSLVLNGLFKVNLYSIVTTTGTGTFTNAIIWSDENGKHTNNLLTNNFATLTTSNQQGGLFIHATTNISLLQTPSSFSGSPMMNIWATVERLQ